MSELPNVVDAIRLEREMQASTDGINYLYNGGYIDGVCASQASQDPYSEDCDNYSLFTEVATVSREQLLHDQGQRQASWLNYIRAVARMEATV